MRARSWFFGVGLALEAAPAIAQVVHPEEHVPAGLAVPAATSRARAPDPADSTNRAPPFVGFSLESTFRAPFVTGSETHHHDLSVAALKIGHPIVVGPDIALSYVVELIPLAIMTGNVTGFGLETPTGIACPPAGQCLDSPPRVPVFRTAYGAGASPLGFQLDFERLSRVHLQFVAHGGVLWFTRRVPIPEAGRFNFTAAAGIAAHVAITRSYALEAGYTFHHTSNWRTAPKNPGVNLHLFHVGVVRRR